TQVRIEETGKDCVRVFGARGMPPTDHYKAAGTWPDGYKCIVSFLLAGRDARRKGQWVAEAIIDKTNRLFSDNGWESYTDARIECLGTETTYGGHAAHAET